MTRVAIYARYSSDKQKETSTEDQIRRCYGIVEQYRLPRNAVSIFADSAMSATGKDDFKRTEYQRLIKAWEANEFDVIVVDEWSRLTRNGVEQAQFEARLENNRRVRLISGDGVDTNIPNWQLIVGFVGIVGRQSTRDTRYRVERGMLGQLERGFMIATPPFGYAIKRELDSGGNSLGTRWTVVESDAAYVREIFNRRENGQSLHQIARWLNQQGVKCVRKAQTVDGGFWRASRVRNLLTNSIYRGEFIWHGSVNYRLKAEKLGVPCEVQSFARPELRLVSDETWSRCNSNKISRSGYGGGKQALAGLFTCGHCHGILAISGNKLAPSLACPSCAQAKSVGEKTERLTVTVATAGAEFLLKEALKYFLTPQFVEEFRNCLRRRLTGDNRQSIEIAEAELAQLRRKQDRLSRILASSVDDDPVLAERYEESRHEMRAAEERLDGLVERRVAFDAKAVDAQLNVDPADMLEHLFEDQDIAPEELRALLTRLFPMIVLEGKDGRYKSTFCIRFATGVALSLASGTSVVDDATNEARFELRYTPDNRSGRAQRWSVKPLREAATHTESISMFSELLVAANL